MTDRLPRLTPANLSVEQSSLYEAIAGGPRAQGHQFFELTDVSGALNGPFGVMLHVPELGMPLQDLGASIRYRTSLSDRAREIAILTVATATKSEFEWYAHEPIGRHIGLTQQELASLQQGTFEGADSAEAAVAGLSQAVLGGAEISDESFAQWRGALGQTGVLEVTVLIGYYRTLADMMRVCAVGIPGNLTE